MLRITLSARALPGFLSAIRSMSASVRGNGSVLSALSVTAPGLYRPSDTSTSERITASAIVGRCKVPMP